MREYFSRGAFLSLLMIFALAPVFFPAKIFDKAAKKQLTAYLEDICQWILAREQAARDGQIPSVANHTSFASGQSRACAARGRGA